MGHPEEKDAFQTRPAETPLVEVQAQSSIKKPAAFYLSFLSLCIMVFITSLDTTTLGVALPVIARELGGTTLETFWANVCFMLAIVVFQPLYMSTSDVLGRKIPLYTAFLLFLIGSLVFALAPNMATVIVGRAIQGLGGSGLDVLNEIITADMTTLKERPLYLGILAIPMAAGAIMGPPVGALLSQFVSWRWIGWINLPLTGIGFFLVFFFLRLRPLEGSFLSKIRRLDGLGMVLFTVGCAAFVLPLSWAGSLYAWGSWQTLLPLVIGTVVLVIFAIYERRPENPVLPHRLFGSVTAVTSLVGAFIHGLVIYNLNLYLPLFFQAVMLETPIQSAVTMMPMNVLALVFSALSPILVGYLRKYLWNIWGGWVFLALGAGLLVLIGQSSSVPVRIGLPVVASVGYGVLLTVLNLPIQASVSSVDDMGLAVGLQVFFRLFGGLIGLAIGSTVFSSVFAKSIPALPGSLAVLANSDEAVGFIPQLRELRADADVTPEALARVLAAYATSFHAIWFVLLGCAGLGFVTSLFTKEVTMEKEILGRQRFEPSSS